MFRNNRTKGVRQIAQKQFPKFVQNFFKKTIDKLTNSWYNNIKERDKSSKRKGVIKMMYFKSTLTGQVYEIDFIPMGEGWELSTKEEYLAWEKAHNM